MAVDNITVNSSIVLKNLEEYLNNYTAVKKWIDDFGNIWYVEFINWNAMMAYSIQKIKHKNSNIQTSKCNHSDCPPL